MSIFILGVVFLVVSLVFSMLGMGGGILYVPILLLAGFSIKQAPAISLILILATSSMAALTFWKNRKVDWKLALVIDPPTDIMAFVGGYFSHQVPQVWLMGFLVVVLITAGTLMLRPAQGENVLRSKRDHWWYWHRDFHGTRYQVNIPLVLCATACIGVLSGMLGITGGIIKLPIMVLLCGVPMDIAVGTSTIMVAVTALSGLAGHVITGGTDWQTGAVLAGSALLGGFLGSHISLNINKRILQKGFGVAVLLIALRFAGKLLFS